MCIILLRVIPSLCRVICTAPRGAMKDISSEED